MTLGFEALDRLDARLPLSPKGRHECRALLAAAPTIWAAAAGGPQAVHEALNRRSARLW